MRRSCLFSHYFLSLSLTPFATVFAVRLFLKSLNYFFIPRYHIRNGFQVDSRRRHRPRSWCKYPEPVVCLVRFGAYAHVTVQAASGIGKETALAFAEAGAKGVVFADINLQGAQGVADESRKGAKHAEYRALAVQLDITEEASVQNLVATVLKEFGRVDYAVNSVGLDLEQYKSFTPMLDTDVFNKIINVHVRGTVFFVRALTGAMSQQEPLTYTGRHGTRTLGRGSIVLLGSTNSLAGAPGSKSLSTKAFLNYRIGYATDHALLQ